MISTLYREKLPTFPSVCLVKWQNCATFAVWFCIGHTVSECAIACFLQDGQDKSHSTAVVTAAYSGEPSKQCEESNFMLHEIHTDKQFGPWIAWVLLHFPYPILQGAQTAVDGTSCPFVLTTTL